MFVVLMLVAATASYVYTQRFFVAQRLDARLALKQHFSQLVNNYADRFSTQSAMFANHLSVLISEQADDGRDVRRVLEKYWELALNSEPDKLVYFYAHSGELLASFGQLSYDADQHELPRALLENFLLSLESKPSFDCAPVCRIYDTHPIWLNDRLAGVVVVSSTLDAVIRELKEATGLEVAIISELSNISVPIRETVLRLAQSGYYFSAASDALRLNSLLAQLELPGPEAPVLVYEDNTAYELIFHDAAYRYGALPFALLILEPVQAQMDTMERFWTSLIYTSSTLVFFCAIATVYWLNEPFSRLRKIALTIPLLADKAFAEIRSTIGPVAADPFDNELTLLHRSTLEVSHRLEQLESEVAKSTDTLRYLAHHDPLTQLLSRDRFRELVSERLSLRMPGIFCFIDLRHFKLLNDTFGHLAGDQVLLHFAKLLKQQFGEDALITRFGGDEFAMLLEMPLSEVKKRLTDVQSAAGAGFFIAGNSVHSAGFSAGLVPFDLWEGGFERLVHCADSAMFEIKREGQAFLRVYQGDEQMLPLLQATVDWKRSIERALKEDRFIVNYQPIRSVEDGTIVSFEALCRMVADDETIISPAQFIPYAEQSGVANSIDRWVVREVCQNINRIHHSYPGVKININLSAASFNDRDIAGFLGSVFEATKAPPECIVFEITETAAIRDLNLSRRSAQAITELGSKLALDDFGSGHGAFVYLSEFPVDLIKIDPSFVTGAFDNSAKRRILASIQQLCSSLSKTSVAEGVEDDKTLAMVKSMGFDMVQGYYTGKPGTIDDLLALRSAGDW